MHISTTASRLQAACVAAALALATSCATDRDVPDLPEQVEMRLDGPGLAASGKHLYMKYCQSCHGAQGRGDGPAAPTMAVAPRDFTSGMYKFRSTPMGQLPTAGDLYRTVAQGVPGTPMPGWDDRLGRQEMWDLVAYVQRLTPGYDNQNKRPEADDIIDIPPAPGSSAEAVARGQQVYAQFGCASCHGQRGGGQGPATAQRTDYKERPIRPSDFGTGIYRSGPHPRDLYRAIATGLSGTPMPGYANSLQPRQIWDLVYYIRSLRQPRGIGDYLLAPEPGRL